MHGKNLFKTKKSYTASPSKDYKFLSLIFRFKLYNFFQEKIL